MGRSKPKLITSPLFEGSDEVNSSDLKRLVIQSRQRAAQSLVENWNGSIVALVTAELSDDNHEVINTSFLLQGNLFPDKKTFSVKKLFGTQEAIKLTFNSLDSASFSFGDSLSSNLVDDTKFPCFFSHEGEALAEEDWESLGLEGFCLRAYATPKAATWITLRLVLYPLREAELLAKYPLASSALFPGLLLFRGDIPIVPESEWLLDKRIGCPVLPGLLAGSSPANISFPSSVLKAAVAKVLRKPVIPETKLSLSQVLRRWETLEAVGEDGLIVIEPDLYWPPSSPPSTDSSAG